MATFLLRLAFIGWLAVAGPLGCTQLFFYPSSTLVRTPGDLGLDYEDVHFHSADGVRLHGWFLFATDSQPGATPPTILFLHGNAENISTHIAAVFWLAAEGYNVFLFDYRGFGRSQGAPDIAGAVRDARAALDVAAARPDTGPLIVFGQSLGGALAVRMLADSPLRARVRGLVLDSAFSDYRRIVQDKLADIWLTWPLQWPLALLMDNEYSPAAVIDQISPIPLLITHAKHDPVVPVHHARALFERAREPKSLWILEHRGHPSVTSREASRQRLLNHLDTWLSQPEAAGSDPIAVRGTATHQP